MKRRATRSSPSPTARRVPPAGAHRQLPDHRRAAGFATVVRTRQPAARPDRGRRTCRWRRRRVQETVTVTGEAPLIDTQSSVLGGNIDPRQMQELPINGRNWMDLAMLAPGSRAATRRAACRMLAPGLLADQHRRPAGDQQLRRHRRRPAALQPRLDRRVRGRSRTASTRRRAARPGMRSTPSPSRARTR